MDTAVSFALAVEGRAALDAAGADLSTFDYEIGHGVSPEEATDARNWIDRAVAGAGSGSPISPAR
jgi:phospholipase/carboxylesterase